MQAFLFSYLRNELLGIRNFGDFMSDINAFIEHVGVKGMKWGVRKRRNHRRTPQEVIRDNRKSALQRRRILKDEDLDKLISRLEKEKKLKTLVQNDLSPGKVATASLIRNVGTAAATTVGTGIAVYAVKAALQKKFDLKEAAGFVKLKK